MDVVHRAHRWADGWVCRESAAQNFTGWNILTADVTVRVPEVAQTLLLLSTAASEPLGSYAQMVWYGVENPYKP